MPPTAKLLATAKKQGFRRGVMGASRAWTIIWVASAVGGWIRKRMKEPSAVERINLKPGQSVLVTDLGISVTDEKRALKAEQQQQRQSRRARRR